MTEYTFTIHGRPITKKNSQRIFRTNRGKGRPFIVQSAAYNRYERAALIQLFQQRPKRIITGQVDIVALYYMPNAVSWPDLTGLMQTTGDVLEKAEIISNDKNIRHWGIGNKHTEIAGIDKDNPRVEIILREVK